MIRSKPAPTAAEGHIHSSVEDDADYSFEGTRREFFGLGQKISGCIIHEDVERTGGPYGIEQAFDSGYVADITSGLVYAARANRFEFEGGGFQNAGASATDVNGCTQLEKTFRHRATEPSASSSD